METRALETVLERLLDNYSFFKDTFASLATMKTIQTTSVIKIVRDRNKPIHHSFMPFGILNRETLEGRIKILDHLLGMLDSFSSDFVKTRYYEMQSRDFTIRYLKIGSVSTYKRIRHRVLRKCFEEMQKIDSLDVYFPELRPIFDSDFKINHQLTDEDGNPISEEEQSG
jgi:hypothetical protein